jgi:hypothetical protein
LAGGYLVVLSSGKFVDKANNQHGDGKDSRSDYPLAQPACLDLVHPRRSSSARFTAKLQQ